MSWKIVATFNIPMVSIGPDQFKEIDAEFVQKVCQTENELVELARDADAVITVVEPFTRRVIENLEKCRVIATPKVGYDNIDVKAATEHGICVATAGDYSREEVSDHAMALLLACARKIVRLHDAAKGGNWGAPVMSPKIREIWQPMFKLREQTLGLVGLGSIARALVPKAKGFGLRVVASDPYIPPNVAKDMDVELVSFDRLLSESDYISIHAVLTKENQNMFGLKQFKKMKPTAYLINTARGELVDTEALCNAVSEGYIAGAGLDVVSPEPPSTDSPLFKLENIIVTAHSGHYSDTAMPEPSRRAPKEVIRVLKGEWPLALINPAVKEKFAQKWGKMG